MNPFNERCLDGRPTAVPTFGRPPARTELAKIATDLGLSLSSDQLAEYAALVARGLADYARLDELNPAPLPSRGGPRDPGRPARAGEEPGHGWTWRCSIRESSDGPLAGRRIAVKDDIAVAGVPMRSERPQPDGYVPRADATVITRLLDAGAEIVGKTAAPLLGDGAEARVIAAGQADMALGTDHGGSVRVPAAWRGCVGFKPTFGLVPYTGILPIERTLDHVGSIAQSVADCALMLEVTAGGDGLDSRQQVDLGVGSYRTFLDGDLGGVRMAVLRDGFGIPGISEPDIDAAVMDMVDALAATGARVEEVTIPMHRHGPAIYNTILAQGATDLLVRGDGTTTNWDGLVDLDTLRPHGQRHLREPQAPSPVLVFIALLSEYVSQRHGHHYYAKAQNLARELRRCYSVALERFDVLALPTVGRREPARPTDGSPTQLVDQALGNLHNTAPFSVTGNPALSIPCGPRGGRPVGLMLVGRPYDDETVLRVGHACDSFRGPLARVSN